MDIIAYIIIGGVGLLAALIMFIFDEVLEGLFDVFDATFLPDGAISGTTIAATLAGFGCAGTAAIAFGVESDVAVAIIAAVVAALAWLVTWAIYGALRRGGTKDGADSTGNYVGLTGNVITAPRDSESWGTMTLNTRGMNNRLFFRTDDEVRSGDLLHITSVLDSSRVLASLNATKEV